MVCSLRCWDPGGQSRAGHRLGAHCLAVELGIRPVLTELGVCQTQTDLPRAEFGDGHWCGVWNVSKLYSKAVPSFPATC